MRAWWWRRRRRRFRRENGGEGGHRYLPVIARSPCDEAIQSLSVEKILDCFAALAMTIVETAELATASRPHPGCFFPSMASSSISLRFNR
ncbi:hypothetical protein C7U65_23725 [Bradyrhizobium sp. WBAH23]|nr:hypothetical protein [Bradyrhizobium sp. WBAH30]MDD1545387.1 hypothetical protein [Bradyrhizobium sp. WBAH41]MDD1558612.1 hypothetical protein [Bradyrhizobium sp. WBAH23]MDD1566537.1 hypothetical protein [Bradyrhizobium sp. WBAH33]MDD1593006.1 hypothetical protein [Bradyrhizobium sp. WBAH42]NRB90394.1 hypothetical protein [Bradyrhizobium sp. WBAH10]